MTFALEIFGDRWTLRVLRDVLLEGRYRYKEMIDANPGLATNVLADRLKRLEQRAIVSKVRDPADARQFIYWPTETAITIIPMLVEMIIWSAKQGNSRVAPAFLERFETDRQGLIDDLTRQVRDRIGPSGGGGRGD